MKGLFGEGLQNQERFAAAERAEGEVEDVTVGREVAANRS
jgi:hypothetical protein